MSLIENFGEGARAQISSNQYDSNLFGGKSGGSPMAANAYSGNGYESLFNSILSPTTPNQYNQMMNTGSTGYGSTGVPNYGGHAPPRPVHQPDFSPHIQNQFLKYEKLLARERSRKSKARNGAYRNGGNGLLDQITELGEQIFRIVLHILNILIGWIF